MNRKSGLLSLSDKVRAAGRGRDTVLAHITPEEAAFLKARGGRGSTNPVTGLPEFEDEYSYTYDPGPSYSYDPGPSYDYSAPSMDYSYSAPSYDYGYSAPSYDYYNPNISIDYSFLNPVSPPTTVTDYYDPGYGYDYDYSPPSYDYTPAPDYTQPSYDYSNPPSYDYSNPPSYDYSTPPSYDYSTPPSYDYSTPPSYEPPQPDYNIPYEPPAISYADPTANLRYDFLGDLSPDAFYRSQFAPEFANEIYSNINPNFSVDEQGTPDVATGDTTDGINTAPLAGDFVDAQGKLITDTVGGLRPGIDLSAEAEAPAGDESGYAALYDKNLPDLGEDRYGNRLPGVDLRGKPIEVRSPISMTEAERKAVIQTIASETDYRKKEGDPTLVQEAMGVGGVIRNRLESGRWGDTAIDVVQAPRQFSGWNASNQGNPNRDPTLVPENSSKYKAAEEAFNQVFDRGIDITGGARNFYAQRSMETGAPPSWANGRDAVNIGPTTFVYDVPGSGGARSFAAGEAPMPPARPSDAEISAYNTPPALPTMITGVGNSGYALPQGVMSYAGQPTPPANIPTQTGETPDANAVTSPSLMDRAIKAAPGAAVDFGLSSLIPFYGPASLAAKVFGIETPGSMIGSNLTGGFANYPGSATATEYVPPVEAPAEIGKLPQTAGGTPIISYPAEGPVQVPSFGTGTYALPGGTQGMSYNAPGSPGADIVSTLAEPSDGAPVPKEYQAPFAAPDRSYILPEELAFAGKPEATSPSDYQPPGQSYELPGYVARAGEPQPYSPPYQPIDKQYALPEELANIGAPETTSPLDYANPDKRYALPPNLGGVRPPGLSMAPKVEQQRIPTPGPMALPASGGYSSSGGGISGLSGGGGGGGVNVSVGGGGGGAARPAATSGGGSLGSVSAANFGFQGIAGANRQFGSPVVESGRTVDFGTPSRQLAYDLNLPAIQQAAMNPNSYRSYLSQYKQLFG